VRKWPRFPLQDSAQAVGTASEEKNKLMKGKTLRKYSLYENIAASVLLKLFISSNKRCHTTDTPSA